MSETGTSNQVVEFREVIGPDGMRNLVQAHRCRSGHLHDLLTPEDFDEYQRHQCEHGPFIWMDAPDRILCRQCGCEFNVGEEMPTLCYPCQVCAFLLTEKPENHNICACCGTEFGLHDANASIAELRAVWMAAPKWWSKTDPEPKDWNPWLQLARMWDKSGVKCFRRVGQEELQRLHEELRIQQRIDSGELRQEIIWPESPKED